jgi:hypothetical protein
LDARFVVDFAERCWFHVVLRGEFELLFSWAESIRAGFEAVFVDAGVFELSGMS